VVLLQEGTTIAPSLFSCKPPATPGATLVVLLTSASDGLHFRISRELQQQAACSAALSNLVRFERSRGQAQTLAWSAQRKRFVPPSSVVPFKDARNGTRALIAGGPGHGKAQSEDPKEAGDASDDV
jgi:hypothetical protein